MAPPLREPDRPRGRPRVLQPHRLVRDLLLPRPTRRPPAVVEPPPRHGARRIPSPRHRRRPSGRACRRWPGSASSSSGSAARPAVRRAVRGLQVLFHDPAPRGRHARGDVPHATAHSRSRREPSGTSPSTTTSVPCATRTRSRRSSGGGFRAGGVGADAPRHGGPMESLAPVESLRDAGRRDGARAPRLRLLRGRRCPRRMGDARGGCRVADPATGPARPRRGLRRPLPSRS